jgi:hypothetical protein
MIPPNSTPEIAHLFNFKEQLIKCAISGVLFGGIMFIYYMIMLKKEYELLFDSLIRRIAHQKLHI